MVASYTEDFKVTWKDPADADQTWLYDAMHFPKPLVPVAAEFLDKMYGQFMNARCALVNGYSFTTAPTPAMPTPEIMRRGALDVWETDFLPHIKEFCHSVRSADHDSMSLATLGATIGDIMADAVHAFGYTMLVVTGFMGPTFGLVQFLEEELGPEGAQLGASLLQGFENSTAAAGAGLSDLAEEAARHPAVAQALRAGRYEGLESLEGGPVFVARLNEYLDEFGWRLDTWGELEVPTWRENPRVPLMLIGRYLADPGRSPAASIQRAVLQREEAVREAESELSGDKLAQFRGLLAASQNHVPISEGRALWQLIIIGSLRVPLLALGRKLADAGGLTSADDVFYMTTDELRAAAENPSPATKEVAARRRADYERWRRIAPPPFLGAPPDLSKMPPEMLPLFRLFFGGGPPDVQGKEIRGQAASKGVVKARARVIHNLAEADRLQAGEVLVCTTTAPPWTPLFAIAGAVVTDSGGVLSHSAICAREFAIPCVVATQLATKVIPDGAMVTVDGTNGVVTIEG